MKKTSMIHCKEFLRRVCTDLDEHLSSAKCRELKKHLEQCKNCTIYFDTLKRTIELYREYPDPKVPSKTHKRLYTTLKLEYAKMPRKPRASAAR